MKNRKGAAFLIVVVLSAFILLLAGLFAILGQADYKNQAESLAVNKALAVAEKGLTALTSAAGNTPDTFAAEGGGIADNLSFYLTRAVPKGSFLVDGFPDPTNAPDLSKRIVYDLFTVYSVGVITKGLPLTSLGTGSALEAALEALVRGTPTPGIIVSSVRVFSSTVVEKETYPGASAYNSATEYSVGRTVTYEGKGYTCKTACTGVFEATNWATLIPTLVFVPNNADPKEISSDGASDLPDGYLPDVKQLPRKSDWQEIALTTFLGTSSAPPIGATFTAAVSGPITITAGANGTVTPAFTTLTYAGGAMPIAATPKAGYHFKSWAVTVNATSPASVSFTNANLAATTIAATSNMQQDYTATVTATFAANASGTITITAGANGTVSPTSTTGLTYAGSAVNITASPSMGYHFVSWGVTNNTTYVSIADSNSVATIITATSNMPQGGTATVTATFAANVSGTITITAGDNGTVTPPTTTLTYAGSAVTITATANAGYHFIGWAVTVNTPDVNITKANLAATTITATNSMLQGGTATVTATFAANVSGVITIVAGTNGTVDTTTTTLTYMATEVAITAIPNEGYHFVSWAGTSDATYISLAYTNIAATTIAATSSMPQGGTAVVTATFAINTYTITASTGSFGTVTPVGETSKNYGATQAYTITPMTIGYHIASVTVDGSAVVATSPYTFTALAANHTISATFALNTYTITASTGNNGTITDVGGMTKNFWDSQTYTITPDAGYHIASLTVDGSAVTIAANYAFANITLDHTIRATFAINTYTLTYIAGQGGAITGTTLQTVNYGTSGTAVTAVPNIGYSFVNWSDAVATATRTDTNVTADKAVTATFIINTYTIIASAGNNGMVTPEGETTKDYGATQAYVITPATGYSIAAITVDGGDVAGTSPYTFTDLAANHTINATFVINTYTITASSGSNGTVTPVGVTTKNFWDSQTYAINPSIGYSIATLTVDGEDVIIAATYTFANITIKHTISATFAVATYTLTYTAGANGTISGPTPQTVNYGNNGTTVTAVPNTGYYFVNWSDTVATADRAEILVVRNIMVTAIFALNTYTITASAGSNGTITPVGGTVKNFWDSQTYTITPNADYTIASLTVDGNAVTIATTYTFENITINHTISATFANSAYTLIYIAGANGTISGTSPQTVNYRASGTPVTAVPNTNYSFLSWSDGGTTATRTDSNVIANNTVTANFVIAEWWHNKNVLTGYTGFGGAGAIPDVLDGFTITSIGNSALDSAAGHLLTRVTIPNGVTTIGASAFQGCSNLTDITIGNGVTSIGDSAFNGCSALTSMTIPASVTSIGNSAFGSCYRLTSITLPNSVTTIGSYAFNGCSGLSSVIIPNSVTSIRDGTFAGCSKLTSVTIPTSVTSIGVAAFSNCYGLTSLTIPSGVTSIGAFAFQYSSLTSLTIPSGVTSIGDSTFYSCGDLISVTGGNGGTSIGDSAFNGCRSLTTFTIPNGVTTIGSSAFNGCSGLPSVTIPSGVTSISNYAFQGCSGLTSLTIPGRVTSIGNHAFESCTGLTNVIIPASVTSIGTQAFYSCSALTSFTVDASNSSYSSGTDGVLFNKARTTLIQYPGSKQGAYVIPTSATTIGVYAFAGCSALTSVTIPSSVWTIGYGAFGGCTALTSVTIGSGVTTIGVLAFTSCTGLTSVTIPNSVTSIGSEAFTSCTGLTSVTIPASVTSIGDSAFGYCIRLAAAYFLGNAPTGTTNMFVGSANGFTIHYISSKIGWTNPWYGFTAVTP